MRVHGGHDAADLICLPQCVPNLRELCFHNAWVSSTFLSHYLWRFLTSNPLRGFIPHLVDAADQQKYERTL